MQKTIKKDIVIKGIGLHSGVDATMILRPAPADYGVVFVRADLDGDNVIPALYDRVADTRLCTVIANADGASVGTIEHIMSALRGCGVDNVRIEIDGPEVPIMDGSADPFVALIDETGLTVQAMPRRAIQILKTVEVRDGDKMVRISPANGFVFGGAIEYDHPLIGTQSYDMTLVNGNYRHDIATARTFGFKREVDMMRNAGLALGGSLDNAIVLTDESVMNADGLRFADEFIRHKLLDAIGDLYLAGGPILGAYDGFKGGHDMNNRLLHALFADPEAWVMVDLYVDLEDAQTPVSSTVLDAANTELVMA